MNSHQHIAEERARILHTIRSFFHARGYLEVETPVLVASPGMEPNLSPFETRVREPNGAEHPAGLITSPEYAMKKLLGEGMEKIFTITKVFRNDEELGGRHNPEFSLLEWYAQGADYHACMDETEALVRAVLGEPERRFARVRVRDLFLLRVGIDLDVAQAADLAEACRKMGISVLPDDTESDLFYRLFLQTIEPFITEPTFVYDYPVHQAALSRLTKDGRYGERFELYLEGLELCNGFTELTDSTEQRRRFEEEAEERRRLGKPVFPIDETLLSLLPSIHTPTYGNALGIDRLQMVAEGTQSIEDVLLFPARTLF